MGVGRGQGLVADGPEPALDPDRERSTTDNVRRRRLCVTAEVVAGVLVVAAAMWPVTAHPADQLAGSIDAPYHAWLGWRIAELWEHGHLLTWVIPDAVAPIGLDLRLIDGLLPAWVTALFNVMTGGNLFLSYNLALATGIGLDLWAGRRLAQVLSSRRWVWFACGVAFATAPALAGSAQAHIAFVYAFTLPLLLREAILLARGEVEVRVGRLVALFAVAYLCSAYHLVFGVITFALVAGLWPRSAVWAKVALVRLGAVAVATLVVLSPFVAARISYERDERAAGSPDVTRVTESLAFSADALGIITPPETLWIDVPINRIDLGPQLYPALRPAFAGYALLVGLALLAFAKRPERRPLLITAAVLWVLSLGPALHVGGRVVGGEAGEASWFMPYRWLQALPGLGALRAPTRAGYALAAVLTAALAVGLDALLDRFGPSSTAAPGSRRVASQTGGPTAAPVPASPEVVSAPSPTQQATVEGAHRPVLAPARERWVGAALAAAIALLLVLSATAPMPTSDLALDPATRSALAQIGGRAPGGLGTDGVLIVPWGCRLDDPRVLALQSIHRQPNVGCNPPPTATRWFSGIEAWASSPELAALRCDPSHIDRRPVTFDGSSTLDVDGVARLRRDLGVRYVVIDKGMVPMAEGSEAVRPGADGVDEAVGGACASVRREAQRIVDAYANTDAGPWTIVDLDRPASR